MKHLAKIYLIVIGLCFVLLMIIQVMGVRVIL